VEQQRVLRKTGAYCRTHSAPRSCYNGRPDRSTQLWLKVAFGTGPVSDLRRTLAHHL
jgi:hypothetical protein